MRSSSHKHLFASALRKTLSPPEARLWVRLRGRETNGPSFRRQHPIGPYVADFYCSAAKLVIEVDGLHHAEASQVAHDIDRDRYLEARGCHVVRVWAAEVMADPGAVAEWIIARAKAVSGGE